MSFIVTGPDAQRGYRHAIDEFVDWHCSEPRLSFNKTVVLLQANSYWAGTATGGTTIASL
jgi:hypothetical protein